MCLFASSVLRKTGVPGPGRPKPPRVGFPSLLVMITFGLVLFGCYSADITIVRPANAKQEHKPSLSDVLPNLLNVSFDIPCKAYYINMDDSYGRRAVIERTFGKLWGPKLVRVSAVNGHDRNEVSFAVS